MGNFKLNINNTLKENNNSSINNSDFDVNSIKNKELDIDEEKIKNDPIYKANQDETKKEREERLKKQKQQEKLKKLEEERQKILNGEDDEQPKKKNNKLFIIIVGGVILLTIILYFAFANNKQQNNQIQSVPDINNTESSTESSNSNLIINTSHKLPDLETINPRTESMLYDFVNGSMNYQFDIPKIASYKFFYAVLRDDRIDNGFFISYYDYSEKLTFPSIGRKICYYEMNKKEIENFDYDLSKVDENRVFKQGNYKMYIISETNYKKEKNQYNYCDTVGRYAGIDFKQFQTSQYSPMYDKVYNTASGWPTDWLRKKPYKKLLKKEGYNMKDEFWEKYPINSYTIYEKTEDGDNKKTLKVYVNQINEFKFTDERGKNIYLNEEELKDFLDIEGWKEVR